MPGELFAGDLFDRELGRGGMATVSRPSVATDPPHSDPIGEKHG